MNNILETPLGMAILIIALAGGAIWLLTQLSYLLISINEWPSEQVSLIDAIRIVYRIHERLAVKNDEIKAELAQTSWVFLSPIAFDLKKGKPFAILGTNNQVVVIYNMSTGECTILSGASMVGNLGSFYIR